MSPPVPIRLLYLGRLWDLGTGLRTRASQQRGTPPPFSLKNKCVSNGSKWPETYFGNF